MTSTSLHPATAAASAASFPTVPHHTATRDAVASAALSYRSRAVTTMAVATAPWRSGGMSFRIRSMSSSVKSG